MIAFVMRRITKEEAYFSLKGKFVRSKDEEDVIIFNRCKETIDKKNCSEKNVNPKGGRKARLVKKTIQCP
jgi:ribosomal protein S27E